MQVPFSYHDGYLSVHFEANKYQDIKLTPLQEEAVWYTSLLICHLAHIRISLKGNFLNLRFCRDLFFFMSKEFCRVIKVPFD